MQKIPNSAISFKSTKQSTYRRSETQACKGHRQVRDSDGSATVKRVGTPDRYQSAMLTLASQLELLAESTLPVQQLGEPVPDWDYVSEFAVFIRLHATEFTSMAVLPFCVVMSPRIIKTLNLPRSSIKAVSNFDQKAMGVMTRTKGRSRSVISLPAIHPIEFVGLFLSSLADSK